jgi:hypothetical protein
MPFEEPTKIIAGLLKKHPNVDFKFVPQTFIAGQSWGMSLPDIPDGKSYSITLTTPLLIASRGI